MEHRARTEPGPTAKAVVYFDAEGAVVTDPAQAVRGEIIEIGGRGERRRRAWFRMAEVELTWLPVRESTFLLCVLAFLATVWIVTVAVLYFI
jgi:hypothetical protein